MGRAEASYAAGLRFRVRQIHAIGRDAVIGGSRVKVERIILTRSGVSMAGPRLTAISLVCRREDAAGPRAQSRETRGADARGEI